MIGRTCRAASNDSAQLRWMWKTSAAAVSVAAAPRRR
jgi:hypothetical protein